MNKALVLLFGATGKSGFHIANSLLDSGFAVRIVVRSKSKVTEMFQERQIGFEKIIQGQLNDQTLKQAFTPSPDFGRVVYAVSALGATTQAKRNVEEIQYLSQIRIIQSCKQAKVDKYIFVTAMLMERPWNPITVLLNTLVPDVYHWKAKAENYLRKSGLNYAIVRPPALEGDQKNLVVTQYSIDQGDKVSGGKITRCTLGVVVKDVILSQSIPSKVTFQCVEKGKKQENQLTFDKLEQDTQKNIVTANHKTPKRVYGLTLLGGILFSGYLLMSKFVIASGQS